MQRNEMSGPLRSSFPFGQLMWFGARSMLVCPLD